MRHSLFRIVIALAIQVALPTSGNAAVITRCVAPTGYSYFFAGGLVPAKGSGMQSDGISAGQYLLMQSENGDIDIIFSDSLGRTISSKDDGGTIIVVSKTAKSIVLLVNYPDMSVETWLFNIDTLGAGIVTVSHARYGETALIRKHTLMSAKCKR
jgi:hypothetical protein